MTKFSQQPFAVRSQAMGDQAERIFENVHPKGYVRWGLDRPPIRVSSLAPKIRYAPDYLTSDGFVEVMGVGRDQLLKLKVEKLIALLQWHQEMPTSLFIWDSKNKRHTTLSVQEIVNQLGVAKVGRFPEGKATWEFPLNRMAAEWVDI